MLIICLNSYVHVFPEKLLWSEKRSTSLNDISIYIYQTRTLKIKVGT